MEEEIMEVGLLFEDKSLHLAFSRKQDLILEKFVKERMEGARLM
jgi:hypothetical protein